MTVLTYFIFLGILHAVYCQFKVSNEIFRKVRIAGLYLAGHKYFDVDKRKGNDLSWRYDERVFNKHFPLPRLKKLHPKVVQNCGKDVKTCVLYLNDVAKKSATIFPIMNKNDNNTLKPSHPFTTELELFQFRTTATYYMCWYTMQRTEILRNFMDLQNCVLDLNKVNDVKWVDYTVVDVRNDNIKDPFLCATILFCPDPCYGRKTEGSVPSLQAMRDDTGNPCRLLKDRTCKWDYTNNVDFESLQKNMFNITCNCSGDRAGFEWFSRSDICVDKDECEDLNTNCDKGRKCENTVGSFECLCPRGQKFDTDEDRCVEHIPLPQHSRARSGRIKALRQKSAWTRMLEYIFGLQKETKE